MSVVREIHPLADLVPAMTEDEYQELCEDIKENGLRVPIVLYEGKVLDGRHRGMACDEVGVEPRYETYGGDEPAKYVVSLNVRRRHLTNGQRAAIALDALPHYKEQARERQRNHGGTAPGRRSNTSGKSSQSVHDANRRARDEAGADVGLSGRTVENLDRVKRDAPELYERVRRGEIPVDRAYREVRKRAGNPVKPEKDRGAGLPADGTDKRGRRKTVAFGKGDKWQESTEPLARYLAAWRKKDFEYAHVNPREAAGRLKRIENLIAGLEAARADLEPRSHKAKLTL